MSSKDLLSEIAGPYAQTPLAFSPWPAWSLAFSFLATPRFPARIANLPPFPQRIGFSMLMVGAGYIHSTGDIVNGSGIAASSSLIYLFLNGRRSFAMPRSPISMLLTGAVALTAVNYGTEYLILRRAEYTTKHKDE